MKNSEKWQPSIVIYNNKKFTINKKYVNFRSHIVTEQVLEKYVNLIKKYTSGTLLDLGCGTVPYYNIYKDLAKEIICIDWDNSYHKNIHLDNIADLNSNIPIENDSIDTVILTDVLEHINKPNFLMKEISRVMRKGGKLILGVPFMYWLHEEPFDYHRYTSYQLTNLCEINSLSILTLEEIGGPLTVIFDIISKNLPSVFLSKLFVKSMNVFLKIKIGYKIDNRNKEKFPVGYCLVAEKI